MRIVGGAQKGLTLASVGKGDPAAHLRPTSDRVRESLFNILMGGAFEDVITGARVLDLFAGTGALGLEALSRGASEAVFVDNGQKSRALLRENIDKTRQGGRARVFRRDATRLGPSAQGAFNLVFIDPPYGKGMGERALASADTGGWIAPNALIVWEENHAVAAPDGFTKADQRQYGDTWIAFLRKTP